MLEVKASAILTVVGIEITKGHTPDGGILNKGVLTLEHVGVAENQTGQGDPGMNGPLEGSGGSGGKGGSGGGIFNEPGGDLTIRQSTISKNLTGNGGRGGEGGQGVNAIGHFPNGGDGGGTEAAALQEGLREEDRQRQAEVREEEKAHRHHKR